MIRIQDLHCGYGEREVLKGIDLTVRQGEMTGILGPNGSGKTTLFLAISGVLSPKSGKIVIDGRETKALEPREGARIVATMPQRTTVSFPFRCLSLVLMGRYPYLRPLAGYSQADHDMAERAMRITGTIHLAQRQADRISGGEFQMVVIARALAQATRLLLLDEATSNLDLARKIQVFDLLTQENKRGLTLMCVMHDLNLAALYCKRLIFLKQGKVVLDGPVGEVFNERNLSEVYETPVKVAKHPLTGAPQVHFIPGATSLPDGSD